MHESITGRQATCLLLVVLSGYALTMTAENGRSGWISLCIAALCVLVFTALCCLPAERMALPSWFDIPAAVFGKTGGSLFLGFLSIPAFWSLCMTVRGGTNFLRTVSGGEWQIWLLTTAILLCAAAAAQHGISRFVLWTEPLTWLVLAVLVISFALSFRHLDWMELFPIFSSSSAFTREVYFLLSVPFGEVFYAAAVLGGSTSAQTRTGLLRACLIASVLLALLYVRNICLLGTAGAAALPYPTYTAAGILSFGASFQRGEVLISGSLIVCTIARAGLLLVFLAGCLQHIVSRGSHAAWVWSAAIVSGIVCVLLTGSSRAYAQDLLTYQELLFPLLLAAALLLLLGTMVHRA